MAMKTVSVDEEYAKNKDLKKEDIESLQQWMEKQPHLPTLSEFELILFLQSCYCKIENTKRTIDTFFTIKTEWPDVFENRDPNLPRIKDAMECCLLAQLGQTPEGDRVLYFTIIDGDASKFNLTDQIKIFDMTTRMWLQESGTAQGLVVLVDVKKLSLSHIARFGLSTLKSLFTYLQEALPVRLKGIHFFNSGSAAEKFLAMSRPFIKAELSELISLYSGIPDQLYKIVPKEYFPKDLGGNVDSISVLHDCMKKKLLACADYFIEDEKFKSDESKRLDKRSSCITGQYGVEGSFKKLELD